MGVSEPTSFAHPINITGCCTLTIAVTPASAMFCSTVPLQHTGRPEYACHMGVTRSLFFLSR
jgi:hypothetical protein